VREAAISVFVGAAGRLHHTIQAREFGNDQLSHLQLSFFMGVCPSDEPGPPRSTSGPRFSAVIDTRR
jgi:hypothetical protein